MALLSSVIEREREYHNRRFAGGDREAQDKYYFALLNCDADYLQRITRFSRDAVVLDYGCSLGEITQKLAPGARECHGIDISDVAIARAAATAAELGLANTQFSVRDAHATGFPDGYFDLVFGSGIIHHLDTEASLAEVARVLKPGGVAVFREPLGCNPFINRYRSRTPDARTEDEHPLLPGDRAIAGRLFRGNDWAFYGLTTLVSVPFRTAALGRSIYRATALLDRMLLSLPGLRWQAWHVVMQLQK
jgi:SAM-dependent methyltransferase